MSKWTGLGIWAHGLGAAAISAFATAASGVIGLPSVFTWDKNGLINMVKMAAVPSLLAVFTYLKQSPIPNTLLEPGDKATVQNPVISPSGAISGTSATLEKAPTTAAAAAQVPPSTPPSVN